MFIVDEEEFIQKIFVAWIAIILFLYFSNEIRVCAKKTIVFFIIFA